MLKNKKVISFVLAMCLLNGASIPCQAYTASSNNDLFQQETVSPRYVNLGNVTAGMSITSNNKAECSGSFFLYSTKNSDITVQLLKSSDGETNWTPVSGESWTNSFTSSGNHTGGGTSSCTLSSYYYYCTFVQVNVYDSNGKVTETATCFSKVYHI